MGNTALYWYFCSLEALNAIQGENWKESAWYKEVVLAVPHKLTNGLWRLPIWDDGYFSVESQRFETSRTLIRSGSICGAFVMQRFFSTVFIKKRTIFGSAQLLQQVSIKNADLIRSENFLEITIAEARAIGLLEQLLC